jgi:hypothetical protein
MKLLVLPHFNIPDHETCPRIRRAHAVPALTIGE